MSSTYGNGAECLNHSPVNSVSDRQQTFQRPHAERKTAASQRPPWQPRHRPATVLAKCSVKWKPIIYWTELIALLEGISSVILANVQPTAAI